MSENRNGTPAGAGHFDGRLVRGTSINLLANSRNFSLKLQRKKHPKAVNQAQKRATRKLRLLHPSTQAIGHRCEAIATPKSSLAATLADLGITPIPDTVAQAHREHMSARFEQALSAWENPPEAKLSYQLMSRLSLGLSFTIIAAAFGWFTIGGWFGLFLGALACIGMWLQLANEEAALVRFRKQCRSAFYRAGAGWRKSSTTPKMSLSALLENLQVERPSQGCLRLAATIAQARPDAEFVIYPLATDPILICRDPAARDEEFVLAIWGEDAQFVFKD